MGTSWGRGRVGQCCQRRSFRLVWVWCCPRLATGSHQAMVNARWWVLSGLGGDARLYQRVRHRWQPACCCWFAGCNRMVAFAERLLACGVQLGDVIGSRFGGMLACEFAQQLPLGGVMLLGSTNASGNRRLALPAAAGFVQLTRL